MPPDLGALYSYCSRKTFFIVPNHTSQQPGLPRKWWYTVGIEQLSCALLGSLQASGSLFPAIFFFFAIYTHSTPLVMDSVLQGLEISHADEWTRSPQETLRLWQAHVLPHPSAQVDFSIMYGSSSIVLGVTAPSLGSSARPGPLRKDLTCSRGPLQPRLVPSCRTLVRCDCLWLFQTVVQVPKMLLNLGRVGRMSSVTETHSNWAAGVSVEILPHIWGISSFHLFHLTLHQASWNGCDNSSCCCSQSRGSDKN